MSDDAADRHIERLERLVGTMIQSQHKQEAEIERLRAINAELWEALRSADHAFSHLECFKIGEANLLLIKQVRTKTRSALANAKK